MNHYLVTATIEIEAEDIHEALELAKQAHSAEFSWIVEQEGGVYPCAACGAAGTGWDGRPDCYVCNGTGSVY